MSRKRPADGITHRQIFELVAKLDRRVGQVEGSQAARYRYDVSRDKSEDAYRKRILGFVKAISRKVNALSAKQAKQDGLARRVSSLETSRRRATKWVSIWKQRGHDGGVLLKYVGYGTLVVVALAVLGFKQTVLTVLGWFGWH